MSKHQLTLLLAMLLGCSPGTPPAGPCTSPSDCPTGYVCLFQECTSPTTILTNLSAVVLPSDPSLAPQQYQPFELNPTGAPQSSLAIVLHQPQQLVGQFILPPNCDEAVRDGTAFPIHMDFQGTSIIPGLPWRFTYASGREDGVDGGVVGVLPVFDSFQRTISPSVPCAPPVLGTQRVLQSGPYEVGKNITFPPASESLRLLGTLTNVDGTPADGAIGTLVSILPSNPSSGQPLSIAVPVKPDATFDLQIPYAQAGPAPLAVLTLSSAGLPNYPAILMPFEGLIVDAGEPTLHLASIDGGPLILTLPFDDDPNKLVSIGGSTESSADGGAPLPGATVQISSLSLDRCAPDAGSCHYLQSTVSLLSGLFSFVNVPGGSYSLTVIPEYPSSTQWFPATMESKCSVVGDCTVLSLKASPGLEVSGWVSRPNQQPFDEQGTVAIYALPSMSVISSTRLVSDGGFSLFAPKGRAMLIVTPDTVTGYPSQYVPLGDLVVPPQPMEVTLLAPGLLSGTVSVEAVDGGTTLPVPAAALLFYYVRSDPADPDGGEIAIPISQGVTDELGNFSVIGPPVLTTQ